MGMNYYVVMMSMDEYEFHVHLLHIMKHQLYVGLTTYIKSRLGSKLVEEFAK